MTSGISPTLFIGIGAWGTAILSDLRAQLSAAHDSLDRLPVFGWLALDFANAGPTTDGAVASAALWKDSEKIALDFDARAPLSAWNQEIAPPGGALARALTDSQLRGASGVRGRARFGFAAAWPTIETRIRLALQTVMLAESSEKSATELGPLANDLRVFVLADLGDATGGGIAAELGFALQSLLPRVAQNRANTQLIGVLALPHGAAPHRDLANAYASLRELHHWNDAQTPFLPALALGQSETGPGPIGQSQIGQTSTGTAPTAFGWTYFWAPTNASGYNLSQDAMRRAVTQWLSLDLRRDSAAHRNAERALVGAARPLDDWNQCTRYFAAGVSALEFPREALSQAVAAHLAASAWKKEFFPAARPGAEAGNALVLQWMGAHFLDFEEWWAQVGQTPEENAPFRVGDLMAPARAHWEANLTHLQNAPPETVQAQVDELYLLLATQLAGRENRFNAPLLSPIPAGEGELARAVRARFEPLASRWERAAIDFAIEQATSASWGVLGALDLLEIARERTAQQEILAAKKAEELLESIGQQREILEGCFAGLAFAELKKHGGIFGLGVRKRQEFLLQTLARAGSELAVLTLERQALEWVRGAWDQARDLWQRPQTDLHNFRDRAQEGERLLRKKASDFQNPPPVVGQLVLDARGSGDLREATENYARTLSEKGEFNLWREVQNTPGSPLANGAFVALMTRREGAVGEALHRRALERTRPFFEQISVLDLFAEWHSQQTPAANRVQELFRAADAYFPLAVGAVTPGWNASNLIKTRRAAFAGAERSLGRSPAQEQFFVVLSGLGFSPQESARDAMLDSKDGTRATFWSEMGGFPLRSAHAYLADLKAAFEREAKDPLAAPLHTREDVSFWLPIDAPSPQRQSQLWEKLLLCAAFGALEVRTSNSGSQPLDSRRAGAEFWLLPPDAVADPIADATAAPFFLGVAPPLETASPNGVAFTKGFAPSGLAPSGFAPSGFAINGFLPWRALVLRLDAPSLEAVLDAHIARAAQGATEEIQARLAGFLARLAPGDFRSTISSQFSGWRDQIFAPRLVEVERQIERLNLLLQDATHAHLHAQMQQRKSDLERQRAVLEGQTSPPQNAGDEIDRLLSL